METVPNTFEGLFWGYTTVWAVIVLYVATLARRIKKLERSEKQDQK
jgi:CcmD family protein